MKRRLLISMMAVALAFSLTGCGSKKEEQTTATTEAASEVKDEFIQFVGTDIPKVEKDEADVMNKYNAYFAEGTSVDTDALLKDLSENLLPKYKTFLDSVESIEVKTDEVMALKDQYYDAMRLFSRLRLRSRIRIRIFRRKPRRCCQMHRANTQHTMMPYMHLPRKRM